ncbi:MAG: hypothetical protein HYS13_07920 [Planctomycetia bacterium]|nr:hypothetical protein [Planctomycetia bacterium]
MTRLSLLLAAVSSALVGMLPAQSPGQAGRAEPPRQTASAAPTDDPTAAATDAQAAAAAEESPRLQKLKQLQFDRRPSAVLKAWAPPSAEPATSADPAATKKDPLDEELAQFQHHVTLGRWDAVKAYLAGLPEVEAKAGYQQLLQSLEHGPAAMLATPSEMPAGAAPGPAAMQYAERNHFDVDDLIGLVVAAPAGLDKDSLVALGGILRQVIAGGTVVEAAVERLKAETTKASGTAVTRHQAAQLLCNAGEAASAGPFLPTLKEAQAQKDLEALNLLARHFQGLHAKKNQLSFLEQAWSATQATLALAGPRGEHEEALRRAVELAPRVRAELGMAWLEQSFSAQPERGMDILAAIGAVAAQGLQAQPLDPEFRQKSLRLQKTAVEALLKAAPERAAQWRDALTLLAANWMREADFSYQFSRGSGAMRMRRDRFGNIFFVGDDGELMQPYGPQRPDQPRPIAPVDVLAARPEEAWLGQVDDGLRPRLAITLCQLHLKADEEAKAFPSIEQLAATHPEKARELAAEFLRTWTRNHDPNAARGYTNPYMFIYGFEQRANAIPLTRSKQERNLVDLAGWVERLRKLPIGDVDEELLAKAFTTCHSTAEVYRAEAIEKVFGPIGGLNPKTLAGLAQQMRENLAGVWRMPAEQQNKQTNRKTKDIQAEVVRGYSVALAVVDDALVKFPDEWSLVLARSAILHDENSFQQELARSSQFVTRRDAALAEFQRAAALYAARVADLPEDEQSTKVYEQWFYAGLGAVDLAHLSEEKQPDLRQPALVRAAILSLPGEAAKKHMDRFANALFTRLSAVKPASKFQYLKGGFEIVGDHPQAAEARKVFDYYKDLVTEIKLEAVIDGPDVVGQGPFGVFVSLRHTREIERESGGFARYLQNQNNMFFAWNYGRPTADYRDRFQTAATDAVGEHFEVLSATFETDKVHSRATEEYGWRVTPYAYLLLKARGPEVDKLPPLRIDLDFLDTSGYVVLPIESPAVPLDAAPSRPQPRPAEKLQLTQTLDERQAAQGKLILEIKATALGLVPNLDELLDIAPEGFEIVKTDDQGPSVVKFEPESEKIAVSSERTWLVSLQAQRGAARPPTSFRFPAAMREGVEMIYQRYEDADLVSVGEVVPLVGRYAKPSYGWVWWAGGAALAAIVLSIVLIRWLRRPAAKADCRWLLPDPLTPFTALGLLERMLHDGQLDESARGELQGSIQVVERQFFSAEGNGDGRADLKELAEGWLRRVEHK